MTKSAADLAALVRRFGWDDRNVNPVAEDALDELERRASASDPARSLTNALHVPAGSTLDRAVTGGRGWRSYPIDPPVTIEEDSWVCWEIDEEAGVARITQVTPTLWGGKE